MASVVGGPVLIEEVPEFEFRGGLFYCTYKIGDELFCRCLRPNTFLKGVTSALATVHQQRIRSAEIIELPVKKPKFIPVHAEFL